MQTITRKGSFDSMHRVMNERMKCFNIHGHTYLYELTFAFDEMASIGYAIDFKEIKRVGCQWIDDILDHGAILNPCDEYMIIAANALQSKQWLMTLNGTGEYCNPTAENIAKELLLAQVILFDKALVTPHSVRLYETPNCYTDLKLEEISHKERDNFNKNRAAEIIKYRIRKGIVNYDDRNV